MREELTLQELILSIRDYTKFAIGKWYVVLALSVAMAAAFGVYTYQQDVTYQASLQFVLSDSEKPSLGASAILGSLGLSSGEPNNMYKVVTICKSRLLLERVLFDSAYVAGQNDLIANHIIRSEAFHEVWEGSKNLADFLFEHSHYDERDRTEALAVKSLYNRIINPEVGLFDAMADQDAGIFTLTATTQDPDLSIVLVETVYDELTTRYVNVKVANKEATLNKLREKLDSVKTTLERNEAAYAMATDRGGSILLNRNRLSESRLLREIGILSTMYGEIVKNIETTTFLLDTEKPAFSIIDLPKLPLSAVTPNVRFKSITGAMVGIFVALFALMLVWLYRGAME